MDIGLVDKRSAPEKAAVPFEEAGVRIAFLTRKIDKEKDERCVYLNILQVDPYA